MNSLDQYFGITAKGSTVHTEFLAGVAGGGSGRFARCVWISR
ncbi:hypothetical protein [Magnetovibrio blakemorei]|nr:hypothetical protein [Magnetovibrio blakemorei]